MCYGCCSKQVINQSWGEMKRVGANRHINMIRTLAAAMLLSITTIGHCASKDTTEQPRQQSGEEILVVTEILPPFQILDDKQQLTGFSTDIIKALFKLTKDTPKIQAMAWPRAYAKVQSDKNIMIYSLAYSPQRADKFHWIGTLEHEKGYLWALKSRFEKPFDNLEQARPFWISTSQNSNPHGFLTRHQFKKLNVVSSPAQNIAMLFRNRTHLAIGTEIPFRYMAQQQGYDFKQVRKMLKIDEISVELKVAFGLNTDEHLVKRYRQAFAKLKDAGTIDKIRRQWALE